MPCAKPALILFSLFFGFGLTGWSRGPIPPNQHEEIQLNEAPVQQNESEGVVPQGRRLMIRGQVVSNCLNPVVSKTEPADDGLLVPRLEPELERCEVVVHAVENCLFMNQSQTPSEKAVRHVLEPNHHYSIRIDGEAWLSEQTGHQADPVPGMILFYCTKGQDGYATKMDVVKPGDELVFETPEKASEHLFLSAFFLDYWPESRNRGQYVLKIASYSNDPAPRGEPSPVAHQLLNVNFGRHPGNMIFDGVVGGIYDYWTLVDVGERHKDALKMADGTDTDVTIELSENDGEWGIAGHAGVYHAYLYHNCRCVDLSARFRHLAAGTYEVYVFAHGDAPDQNAEIVIESAGTTYSGRKTVNDGTDRYRSHDPQEGIQYVKYTIQVEAGQPVTITSKRDGSSLSMLNAIQFRRLID